MKMADGRIDKTVCSKKRVKSISESFGWWHRWKQPQCLEQEKNSKDSTKSRVEVTRHCASQPPHDISLIIILPCFNPPSLLCPAYITWLDLPLLGPCGSWSLT